MIKPIKITALNTTKFTYSECKSCGFNVEIYWQNRLINTDKKSDIEDMLFEPCPKCGKKLGDKEDFLELLENRVTTAIQICDYLLKDSKNKTGLINEYKNIFDNYLDSKDIDDLKAVNGVFYRPSLEGSETDFTTVTKINLDNQYISLDDLIEEIQNLIINIEKI